MAGHTRQRRQAPTRRLIVTQPTEFRVGGNYVGSTPVAHPVSASPNVLVAGVSILKSLLGTRPPRPVGSGDADHSLLEKALTDLSQQTAPEIVVPTLMRYIEKTTRLDPDTFSRDAALAFWLNLYNAGTLLVAAEASARDHDSVLRTPGAFTSPAMTVGGERLSLDAIEHGKLRRFGDPRIHTALVCGSVSCPTLRSSPYSGAHVRAELDVQIRHFLSTRGASYDAGRDEIRLSRVFSWYGSDFVRPHRMPTLVPSRRRRVLDSLVPWLPDQITAVIGNPAPRIRYLPYDWGLRCTVG